MFWSVKHISNRAYHRLTNEIKTLRRVAEAEIQIRPGPEISQVLSRVLPWDYRARQFVLLQDFCFCSDSCISIKPNQLTPQVCRDFCPTVSVII